MLHAVWQINTIEALKGWHGNRLAPCPPEPAPVSSCIWLCCASSLRTPADTFFSLSEAQTLFKISSLNLETELAVLQHLSFL